MKNTVFFFFVYLAAYSEKAAAVGVHEDEFASVAQVRAVRIDPEDKLALAVVDCEAIAREEEGGFGNGEEGLLIKYVLRILKQPLFHFFIQ